jgi:spore coat protein U-like protein
MVPGVNVHRRRARTSTRLRALRLGFALALALGAPAASAQCFFWGAVGPMTFTGYSPFGGPAAATANVSVFCLWTAQPSVSVAVAPRTMTAGGVPALPFEIYTDAGHTQPWPAGYRVAFAAAPWRVTTVTVIFGGIAAGQDVAATTYSAQVNVSLYNGNTLAATQQMTVQATVAGACEIVPGALAFGNYDAIGTHASSPLDAQGQIGVRCTRNTPYAVGLDFGANGSGSTRQMANGAARLTYELYSDPTRMTVWTPSATLGGTAGNIADIPLPVYGRIPPAQIVQGGPYQDTVIATVTF